MAAQGFFNQDDEQRLLLDIISLYDPSLWVLLGPQSTGKTVLVRKVVSEDCACKKSCKRGWSWRALSQSTLNWNINKTVLVWISLLLCITFRAYKGEVWGKVIGDLEHKSGLEWRGLTGNQSTRKGLGVVEYTDAVIMFYIINTYFRQSCCPSGGWGKLF